MQNLSISLLFIIFLSKKQKTTTTTTMKRQNSSKQTSQQKERKKRKGKERKGRNRKKITSEHLMVPLPKNCYVCRYANLYEQVYLRISSSKKKSPATNFKSYYANL